MFQDYEKRAHVRLKVSCEGEKGSGDLIANVLHL